MVDDLKTIGNALRELGRAIVGFPLFLLGNLIGLLLAILTEVDTLVLVIAAVIVGAYVAPWVGLAGFLVFYGVLRVWGAATTQTANQINFLARVIRDNRNHNVRVDIPSAIRVKNDGS